MASILTLDGLDPAGMPYDSGAFTLRVLGGEFQPDAKILLDGADLPTIYAGPSELQAQLTESGTVAGEVAVQVRQTDPDVGSQYSNELPFLWVEPEPEPEDNLFNPENVPHPYLRYDIQTRYLKNNGTLAMPIAGPPGTPQAIIQVCAPYGQQMVDFLIERQGADPEPPNPQTVASGGILRTQEIAPINKILMADGLTHVHRMVGQYVYDLALPLDETTPLQIGSPPYDLTPPEENQVLPEQYKEGII